MSKPLRDEILLERGQACVVRAASKLRAALDAYRRGGADEEILRWVDRTIEDVEALANVNT